jgi:hypothetical protein
MLPWLFAFVSTCYQKACNEDDDWGKDEIAAAAIAIQNQYSCGGEDLAIDIPLTDIENLTFLFEKIMRSNHINIELKGSEDLILVNADVLLELLHLLFVEGLSAIGSVVYDIVEAIAKRLQAAVNALEFGSQEEAGSQDKETIEMNV